MKRRRRSPRNSQSISSNRCENSISDELLADGVGLEQELIVEILLHLPVKSLSRFKCVSKSWLRLISSQHFIRSHLSTWADLDVNFQVLFKTLLPTRGIKRLTLNSAVFEPSENVSDIEFLSDDPVIIGIVNGLVCVHGAVDFCLWNPALRKFKHIPGPKFSQRGGFKYLAQGFGYDESNDDYKVVSAVSDDGAEVMVYSLLTDSWTRIEGFEPGLRFSGFGKYANGKIHWTASSSDHEWKIVSLDMVNDKYGEMQRPEYGNGVKCWSFGVLRGKLFVHCSYYVPKGELWVMNEYGVHESWSKLVSIPYLPGLVDYVPWVICILRYGEIVLSTGRNLLVYHPNHKEFSNFELGFHMNFDTHMYVESLVSPNGSAPSSIVSSGNRKAKKRRAAVA